jgi:hypothetical protein
MRKGETHGKIGEKVEKLSGAKAKRFERVKSPK